MRWFNPIQTTNFMSYIRWCKIQLAWSKMVRALTKRTCQKCMTQGKWKVISTRDHRTLSKESYSNIEGSKNHSRKRWIRRTFHAFDDVIVEQPKISKRTWWRHWGTTDFGRIWRVPAPTIGKATQFQRRFQRGWFQRRVSAWLKLARFSEGRRRRPRRPLAHGTNPRSGGAATPVAAPTPLPDPFRRRRGMNKELREKIASGLRSRTC